MSNLDRAIKAVKRSPLGASFLTGALEAHSRAVHFDPKQSKELRELAQIALTYLGENEEGEH